MQDLWRTYFRHSIWRVRGGFVAYSYTSRQVSAEEEKTPKWASEFCAAMAREVQSALTSKPTPPSELRPQQGYQYAPPMCFRCGQVGHIQRGCRNTPQTLPSGNANMPLTQGYQRQNTRRPRPNTQNSGQSH